MAFGIAGSNADDLKVILALEKSLEDFCEVHGIILSGPSQSHKAHVFSLLDPAVPIP